MGEKKSRKQLFLSAYILFLTVFFALVQIWAVLEVIPLGWHRELVFWVGAVFWGVFGFFWHEIMCWFQKENWWAGFALVFAIGVLALFAPKTGPISLKQFLFWSPLSIATLGTRALFTKPSFKKQTVDQQLFRSQYADQYTPNNPVIVFTAPALEQTDGLNR